MIQEVVGWQAGPDNAFPEESSNPRVGGALTKKQVPILSPMSLLHSVCPASLLLC